MPNLQPMPMLDQVKDRETRDAIRKLWEALYVTKSQVAAAFAVASPSTQTQVLSLLGLQ